MSVRAAARTGDANSSPERSRQVEARFFAPGPREERRVDAADNAVRRNPHRRRRLRPFAYEADADWHRSLHAHLGSPWPCRVEPEFRRRWAALVDEMSARGLA